MLIKKKSVMYKIELQTGPLSTLPRISFFKKLKEFPLMTRGEETTTL